MRLQSFWCLMVLLLPISLFAKTEKMPLVFSKSGNIYYAETSKNSVQITQSGQDISPVISHDKKFIAFIRESNQVVPKVCENFVDSDSNKPRQIWVYEVATKTERLLVANNFACDKPEQAIVDAEDLQFSLDSKKLYFLTPAWVTSAALHVINVDGSDEHYVIPANAYEIIAKGEYKNDLIVDSHRYFLGGGSYDWYWLYTGEGKELGPLGPEVTRGQREFLGIQEK